MKSISGKLRRSSCSIFRFATSIGHTILHSDNHLAAPYESVCVIMAPRSNFNTSETPAVDSELAG